MKPDEILSFERAITESGHILIPRTSLNCNVIKTMTDEERKEMLTLLEHAKEFFKKGSPYYLGEKK